MASPTSSNPLEIQPGLPGTASYSVRVENDYGEETSTPAAVETVTLSFGGWASRFTTPESGAITPDGDLNGDGISNFLDFAFGTAPGETRRHLPQVRVTQDGPVFVHRQTNPSASSASKSPNPEPPPTP